MTTLRSQTAVILGTSGDARAVAKRDLYNQAIHALGQLWLHARNAGDTELCDRVEAATGRLTNLDAEEISSVRGKTLRGTP